MPCGNLDMHFGDYCVPELLCDSFHTCSHACHFGPHLFASGCIPAPPHGGTTTPLCIPAVIEHCKSYHRQSWSYTCHITCLPCGHTCSHPCHHMAASARVTWNLECPSTTSRQPWHICPHACLSPVTAICQGENACSFSCLPFPKATPWRRACLSVPAPTVSQCAVSPVQKPVVSEHHVLVA